ncbi:hypothetical protein [uncultured Eubacterium sp.]|uniref:hypothetical protein n=1 Tax=uncultured Eubacterium sp. TaxID=165185 RepID=UPI0017E45E09|nr:hypothetical protein [uncultured Eubacterium sp.]HII09124.1 hypothetical protein [Methanosphaera sp.]
MKSGKTGKFVLYKNVICRLLNMCGDEFIKGGYYISIKDNRLINSECIEWLGKNIKPVNLEEIDNLYEISHYIVCNGRKYKHFDYFPEEKGLWVYAADWGSNTEVDPKYEVVESGRDGIYIEVPYDEVTLYETKTYYDKDKFINEDIREVLSEETYLIDEPWWLEETKDN